MQAVAGRLQVLEVSCGFDVSLHLLPPLPSLKRLSLLWYSGRNGPSGKLSVPTCCFQGLLCTELQIRMSRKAHPLRSTPACQPLP